MKRSLHLFCLGLLVVTLWALNGSSAETITLSCKTFQYELGTDGRNQRFVDLQDNRDYLKQNTTGSESFCAYLKCGTTIITPDKISYKNSLLNLSFNQGEFQAVVRVEPHAEHLVFEVVKVEGKADTFVFLNIPLELEAMPYEPFAACALSLNLHTEVIQMPALQNELWASCHARFGFAKARAAVIGVPQARIIAAIRSVMREAAADIPLCDQGGAWALETDEGYGSYLMNHGTLTEKTVDNWISYCKKLGFNQIIHHGNAARFFDFGSFDLNPEHFPEGWEGFKKINDKLRAAGISSILLTYTCYIDQKSRYVTPVPHPDLDLLSTFTLAEELSPHATTVVVRESTAEVSTKVGYLEDSNRTLRIGDEIIRFEDVTRKPPYKFTGCVRGYHATKVSAHTAGSSAGILKTFWNGMYIPHPESKLFDEIAHHTAELIDKYGFSSLTLDAIEGLQYMWGRENYWYYGSKFVFEIMRHLKKPVGFEFAGMIHHWWHYNNRWQAWDMVYRSYKRFTDVRIASLKARDEYQHGAWGGYTPEIDRLAALQGSAFYQPLHLGWWRLVLWNPPRQETMFIDDIEYLCCKMIGNQAGLSLLGGENMSEERLKKTPIFYDMIKTIRQYEELRKKRYFSEEVEAKLRQPGKEFTLFQDSDNKWNFKPITYNHQKVEGLNHLTSEWSITNEYATQPLRLRVQSLIAADTNDFANQPLIIGSEVADNFVAGAKAEGVICSLAKCEDKVPATGETGVLLKMLNTGKTDPKASWACLVRTCEPGLKLDNNQALGGWIKGDGNGQIIDIRLFSRSSEFSQKQSSHFVKLDFTGWRFFTLVELEAARISDYKWLRLSEYCIYDSYRDTADYSQVDEVQIWINNLPQGKPVECVLGPIRALPNKVHVVDTPAITVNDKTVVLPFKLLSGAYAELSTTGELNHYNPVGKLLATTSLAAQHPVMVKSGVNQLRFESQNTPTIQPRLRVTVITQGEPL